jgi:curved DNA-binding protein CbpA
MKDYYYILGINNSASMADIKKAYKKLALKFHPDKNDGDIFFNDRFKEINEAYEILTDESKKRKYDSRKAASGSKEESKIQSELLKFKIEIGKLKEKLSFYEKENGDLKAGIIKMSIAKMKLQNKIDDANTSLNLAGQNRDMHRAKIKELKNDLDSKNKEVERKNTEISTLIIDKANYLKRIKQLENILQSRKTS